MAVRCGTLTGLVECRGLNHKQLSAKSDRISAGAKLRAAFSSVAFGLAIVALFPFQTRPSISGAMEEGAPEPEDASKAQRIAVFLRLRPVARPSGRIAASPQEGWVQFDVPKDAAQG